jgi:catechol 2,3-dioxygenase-like lactoylglutathione lyase family enzyme
MSETRAPLKIRHLAFASDHPGKAANFWKEMLGFRELHRFGIPADPEAEAPRPSGVFLTDGNLNIAILKFGDDQLGKGLEYTGIHHFGVVVDDVATWTEKLNEAGAPVVPYEVPPGTHAEYKFRGPDGIVFDITGHNWDGAAND